MAWTASLPAESRGWALLEDSLFTNRARVAATIGAFLELRGPKLSASRSSVMAIRCCSWPTNAPTESATRSLGGGNRRRHQSHRLRFPGLGWILSRLAAAWRLIGVGGEGLFLFLFLPLAIPDLLLVVWPGKGASCTARTTAEVR